MKKDYLPVSQEDASLREDQYIEEHWTRLWKDHQIKGRCDFIQKKDEYKAIKQFLDKLPKGCRVLDGGCGTGSWTIWLTECGFDVTGLDISAQTIEKLESFLPQYKFFCGDIRRTDFEPKSFDAYFSWGTFEHFENGPGECLVEAGRILKQGGYLFITVPFHNWRHIFRDSRSLEKWDSRFDCEKGYEQPQRFYQWRFTEPELKRELELAGFKVMLIKPIHKYEGMKRFLHGLFGWVPTSSLIYRGIVFAISFFIPAKFASHMILAAAVKR